MTFLFQIDRIQPTKTTGARMDISELEEKIKILTDANTELMAFKQEHASAKQSLNRMSARLRKLCKRLAPTNESVIEMKEIAEEIRDLCRDATK